MRGSLAQNTKTKQKKEVWLLRTMMSQYATCDDCVKAKHCTRISCKVITDVLSVT